MSSLDKIWGEPRLVRMRDGTESCAWAIVRDGKAIAVGRALGADERSCVADAFVDVLQRVTENGTRKISDAAWRRLVAGGVRAGVTWALRERAQKGPLIPDQFVESLAYGQVLTGVAEHFRSGRTTAGEAPV